jgi:hypothetical protein
VKWARRWKCRLQHQLLVSAWSDLVAHKRDATGHGRAWTVPGRVVSWAVLRSIPLISMGVTIAALSGRSLGNPMWTVLSLILAVVFVHGAERVRWEMANDRTSSQAGGHPNQPG